MQLLGFLLSLIVGISAYYLDLPFNSTITLAITCLTAFFWVTEAVPIPIASLIPIALFPLFGILSPITIAKAYGSPLILLLMGGFMLSKGLEHCQVHKRIALTMIRAFGKDSPKKVVFGFMATACSLSMWLSNSATTLMLLPVAIAVLDKLKQPELKHPLLLGIAYAASIGGVGTPIGTPPNLIFLSVYEQFTQIEIGFLEWMRFALPLVFIIVPLAAIFLTRNLKGSHKVDLEVLPPISPKEKRVLTIFGLTALGWLLRTSPMGGWQSWLNIEYANDASVALIGVICMFCISDGESPRGKLLNWTAAKTIPWGTLLLFAGGIVIAFGFMESGLSSLIGNYLDGINDMPLWLSIGIITILVIFLTEITSNTATTNLLMPILAATAIKSQLDPRLYMLPATIAASCAFMLPVATAPNSIIYGSKEICPRVMAKEGFFINLIAVSVIIVWFILAL